MTLYLPKWIRNGFSTARSAEGGGKGVKNVDLIKHLLVLLRRRGPNNGVTFKYVPGHSGVEGNEGADVRRFCIRCAGCHGLTPAPGEDGRHAATCTGSDVYRSGRSRG